jgi:hypothetical protein
VAALMENSTLFSHASLLPRRRRDISKPAADSKRGKMKRGNGVCRRKINKFAARERFYIDVRFPLSAIISSI